MLKADDDLGAADDDADDGMLLAEPPAKRDLEEDGSYLTPGARGKRYTPSKRDKRKDAGPRTKNYNINPEISSRTIFQGWKGSNGMNQVRNGLMEDQRSNYEKRQELDEQMLFQRSHEIKELITGLETKETKDEAQ